MEIDVCCKRFLSGCCICFHTYIATVCFKYFSCFSLTLKQVFFHVAINVSAFECFMLPTAGVGVHEGGQGQDGATDIWRRRRAPPAVWGGCIDRVVLLWKRQGESSGRPERDRRRAGVAEAGASHPSSVGSRSEAGGSDASARNTAGAGGM
jgi:hypothetical protein